MIARALENEISPDRLLYNDAKDAIEVMFHMIQRIAAAHWLCEYFNLSKSKRNEIIESVDRAKPNSKGFDANHISNLITTKS